MNLEKETTMKFLTTLIEIQKNVETYYRKDGESLTSQLYYEIRERALNYPEAYKGQEDSNRIIYQIVYSNVRPTDRQINILLRSRLWISLLILALNQCISEDVIRDIYRQKIPKQSLCDLITQEIHITIEKNRKTPDDVLEELAHCNGIV